MTYRFCFCSNLCLVKLLSLYLCLIVPCSFLICVFTNSASAIVVIVAVMGVSINVYRGVARIFQRGGHRQGHHPVIADYMWFIPVLSLVYQRAQSYYLGMKAHIN